MAELISHLKKYPKYKTSLIYMSDHGESLGENGIYLHGMPYAIAPKEQTHIPFIMWLSDAMIAHKKLDMTCLKDYAQKGTFSHDNLSATLLGLLDIETKNYVPEKDVLKSCQKSSKKD
jgi:lipid A ethanolaminephosphotransferase